MPTWIAWTLCLAMSVALIHVTRKHNRARDAAILLFVAFWANGAPIRARRVKRALPWWPGTIYVHLQRLKERGLLEKVDLDEFEQWPDGNPTPWPVVAYKITTKGRDAISGGFRT